VVDQHFQLLQVAGEIVSRIYLTIGFAALLGLCALGATSTDAAIRRLGRNWTRLHKLVYPITALALLHQFMQSKADVGEPTLYTGFFLLLMAYRVVVARGIKLTPVVLVLLAVAAPPVTMAIEAAWYGLATALPVERIFLANFDFTHTIRPSWWVGIAGLAVALVAAALPLVRPAKGARAPRPAPAPALVRDGSR
jgi:sulfoxide reductase heme-binding subunit YedZ